MDWERLKQAVIAVGDGRGFLIRGQVNEELVVTAAHCLPYRVHKVLTRFDGVDVHEYIVRAKVVGEMVV